VNRTEVKGELIEIQSISVWIITISFGSEKYPLKCVDARTLANDDRPACQNLHPLIYNGHGDHFPHVIK
jgi:hypothetical protein